MNFKLQRARIAWPWLVVCVVALWAAGPLWQSTSSVFGGILVSDGAQGPWFYDYVARALSSGLAEMFLPAMLLKDADVLVKFVTAIVSVSSVLFLSASIPCVLATRIPLSLGQLLLIWLQRTLLSLLFAIPLAYLAQFLGWL